MPAPRIYPPGATAADYQREYRRRKSDEKKGRLVLAVTLSEAGEAAVAALKRPGEDDRAAMERLLLERR